MEILASNFRKRRSMGSAVSGIQANALSGYTGPIHITDPKGELADTLFSTKRSQNGEGMLSSGFLQTIAKGRSITVMNHKGEPDQIQK